jgi:hypothetical protein
MNEELKKLLLEIKEKIKGVEIKISTFWVCVWLFLIWLELLDISSYLKEIVRLAK